MRRVLRTEILLGVVVLCGSGVLCASEADELRAKAQALRKQAAEVSQNLERQSQELLNAAERLERKARGPQEPGNSPEIEARLRKLGEHLQNLLAMQEKLKSAEAPEPKLAEVREQIAATERELKQLRGQAAERDGFHPEARRIVDEPQAALRRVQKLAEVREHIAAKEHRARPLLADGNQKVRPEIQRQFEQLQAAMRRIHHMRAAAENLKQAEIPDVARHLMDKAAEMERDVQAARQRLAVEMHASQPHPGEPSPDVIRELRGEIERLRTEVRELSKKIEKH